MGLLVILSEVVDREEENPSLLQVKFIKSDYQ